MKKKLHNFFIDFSVGMKFTQIFAGKANLHWGYNDKCWYSGSERIESRRIFSETEQSECRLKVQSIIVRPTTNDISKKPRVSAAHSEQSNWFHSSENFKSTEDYPPSKRGFQAVTQEPFAAAANKIRIGGVAGADPGSNHSFVFSPILFCAVVPLMFLLRAFVFVATYFAWNGHVGSFALSALNLH